MAGNIVFDRHRRGRQRDGSEDAAVSIKIILFLVVAMPISAIAVAHVYIPTSDAVRIAQMIAIDEGYDISNTDIYYFDSLDMQAKPLVTGYTSMGFYMNAQIVNMFSINDETGQVIDMNSCEIFEYKNLLPFQNKILKLSKSKIKAEKELADEVGCLSPVVVTKTIIHSRK